MPQSSKIHLDYLSRHPDCAPCHADCPPRTGGLHFLTRRLHFGGNGLRFRTLPIAFAPPSIAFAQSSCLRIGNTQLAGPLKDRLNHRHFSRLANPLRQRPLQLLDSLTGSRRDSEKLQFPPLGTGLQLLQLLRIHSIHL